MERDIFELWLNKATRPHFLEGLREFFKFYGADPNELVETWKRKIQLQKKRKY